MILKRLSVFFERREDPRAKCLVEPHTAAVERFYRLEGRKVADVPEMALWRLQLRRSAKHWTFINFLAALANAWLWLGPLHSWLNSAVVPLTVYCMYRSEQQAWRLTRQLNRRAAEQLIRDRLWMRD